MSNLLGGQSCVDALQFIKKQIEEIEREQKKMPPIQFTRDVEDMLRPLKTKLDTLDQLEMKNVQSTTVIELREGVSELKRKINEFRRQEQKKNFVLSEVKNRQLSFKWKRHISTGSFLDNVKMLRCDIVNTIEYFQDRIGALVGYIFVFFFGYQTWKQSFSNLWWDNIAFLCGTIESWKIDLQNQQRRAFTPKQGFIHRFFNFCWRWTIGWITSFINFGKRVVVTIYDYFNPILRGNETMQNKMRHMYNDAKGTIPGGIKDSVTKGTHYAMAPMKYMASSLPKSNITDEILNVMENIDPLMAKTTESKLQQKQRRRSVNVGTEVIQSSVEKR